MNARHLPRVPLLHLLAACALCTGTAHAQPDETASPYWSDRWRGWHFYEDPVLPAPASPQTPERLLPRRTPSPQETKPPEVQSFERLQKTLETQRQIAIMRPTQDNVLRYMSLEAQVVQQAAAFADMARRVAWSHPQLDPSLEGRPVNAQALEVFDKVQSQDRTRVVTGLAKDHALIFFFRGDCPYCHAFAPVLQAFTQRFGLKVLAISLDGGRLEGFADIRPDNGIARNLQVAQVPALFLAQPFKGQITPLGFGVMSEAQLLERLALSQEAPAPAPLSQNPLHQSVATTALLP